MARFFGMAREGRDLDGLSRAGFSGGSAKRDLTVLQAKAILATVRLRDITCKTRRRIGDDELADLIVVVRKMKKAPPSSRSWSPPAGHG